MSQRIENCPGLDPVMGCASAINCNVMALCSRCRAAAARRDRASLPPETGDVHPRRNVVVGVQSRFYDSAASAALYYPASGRTALGTSTVVAGAAGATGNVIRNTDLIPTWQAIASTQATGGGTHFSHVGSFRVRARTYRPTGNTGAVSIRLEWAEGDFRRRTLNDPYNFAAVSCTPPFKRTRKRGSRSPTVGLEHLLA
jgi:hypothetical protein